MNRLKRNSFQNGKKRQVNRRNPMTEYWMQEEIFAHDSLRIFPDWSHLAHRGMESLRRDYSASYIRHRSAILAKKKEYRQRPEVKAAHAKRQRDKKKSDPGFRVARNLSRRLCEIMNSAGQPKAGRSVQAFIGCSTGQLRAHIERQFKGGMSWSNYGTDWQVDHIIPCASFDHSIPSQARACWHWSNLRPLGSKVNAAKSDKMILPQMALQMEFH